MTETKPILETTVLDRPAVPDVLEEHLEETAFLLIRWRKLLFSSEIPLRRLGAQAERIEAHLDGLRVGGPASLSIALAMLDENDPWFVSVAARVWIELGQPEVQAIHERLAALPPELFGVWKEAFRQLPASTVQRIFPQQQFESLPAATLEIAADAWGWHGLLPFPVASRLAGSPAPGVRRAVARHTAHSGLIRQLLDDGDVLVRRMAHWSLALQNTQAALDRGRQLAAAAEPDPFALRVIGLLGGRADGPRLLNSLKHKAAAPTALLALRDLAVPEFAEVLLIGIEGDDADFAALAKDVFESLAGRIPKPDPGQPLPPGLSPARAHWSQVRKQMDGSKRMLHGQAFPWQGPASEEPMQWVWRRVLTSNAPDLAWLRRQVPDGFFNALGAEEAIPGE